MTQKELLENLRDWFKTRTDKKTGKKFKGLEARRSPTAASSSGWGREALTLTCWLWCPGMSAGRISLRTSITTLPKSLRSLQGFCASDQVQVQGH